MPPSPDLIALYARPIILWVEDSVTSTYLGECWNDSDIAFRLAGGIDGVRTIVRSAQANGFGHVFGFVDRDFGTSNRPFWLNANASAVFVPDIHEVENYLLTSDHLANCDLNNGGRSAAAVEDRLRNCAGTMVWWMACRQVLRDLRAEYETGFPPHSRVSTQAEAEQHICGSGWYKALHSFFRTLVPAYKIRDRLTVAHGLFSGALASGQWRQSFSGKELLRDLHLWLYTPPVGGAATAAERDRDLARSVARWQVANGAIPAEVTELRMALRHRVGI